MSARRRLHLALVLVLAMLAAQSLALLHGVAHAPLAGSHAGMAAHAPGGWGADHDAGTAQCRLIDHLGQHAISVADAAPWLAEFTAEPPRQLAGAPRIGGDTPARLARGPPPRAA